MPRVNRKKAVTVLKEKSCSVVGIGASAGGLEAFTNLLKNLPADTGMAFVFIQHLAPKHESVLDEILSRNTKMPVHTVKNNERLKPNNVYVIPPDKDISISGATLNLKEPLITRGQHMPIDRFFSSLADARGAGAVGIVLSGTAHDGTSGLKAIKAAGGITFAQDEKSAQYADMPRNAVASGFVDLVLSPQEIAWELAKINRFPYLRYPKMMSEGSEFPEKGDAFGRIFFMLSRATGVDFTFYKRPTINRRIKRRMLICKVARMEDYVEFLRANKAELQALYEDILISVTDFFREPEVYAAVRKKVFPALIKNRPSGIPIRIWVPGCATGEEAYSIAIFFQEFMRSKAVDIPVQIFATDISEKAIARARAGIYPESIKANVPPEILRRFFVKTESGYRINKSIREMCVFAKHNLIKDPPFSNMDFISCRNLLIYLGSVLQKNVIPMLHYALKPGGFLLLGVSEGIGGFSNLFSPIDKKRKIYLRKQGRRLLEYEFTPERYKVAQGERVDAAFEKVRDVLDPQEEADRILLNKYVPTAVLITGEMETLRFWGHTTPYLEHVTGKASLDFLRMVRDDLAMDVRSVIHEAQSKKISVKKENIKFRCDGRYKYVDIEVVPIKAHVPGEDCFLVLFEQPAMVALSEGMEVVPVETKRVKVNSEQRDREITRLQNELDKSREYAQSVVERQETATEELKSSLEELQSTNEELQSTNEELETAKEELQSTNEELATVNEELENRNVELDKLNNDLINLLSSVNIPIVMLGEDLCIRRFNSPAQKMFNIIPSDVGRKFTNIKPDIDMPDPEEMILGVIESLKGKEMEVRDSKGHWYDLVIRPYVTMDKKIDGVVISVVDIDRLKRVLEEVERFRAYAESVIQTIREPLVVLDPDLKVAMANRSFYRYFKMTPGETVCKFIYDLGGKEWDIPRLRQLLGDILPKKTQFEDFEMEHDFPRIGQKTLLLNARRIVAEQGKPDFILLAFEDITERRRTEEIKTNMVRDITHSLKTPLATVKMCVGESSVAMKSGDVEKTGVLHSIMCNNIDIALRNVDNILEAELLKRPGSLSEKKMISLRKVTEEVIRDFTGQVGRKDLVLKVDIPKSADDIRANKKEMKMLLSNIIDNAIKFTDKGRVTLSARAEGKMLRIKVRDTGVGVSAKDMARVFDSFYKSHITVPGVGIGLTICKGIVRKYGGDIRILSKGKNKGTTIIITLPRN